MTENQTVLFVDDEQNVLRALQRLCRKEPYQIRVADGGKQALEIMASHPVDLIVSDLKMPGQDGTELLKAVALRFPHVGRVLMSGNADLPSLVNAVNQGQLSYYFEKPWNDIAIKLSIRELLERNLLENNNRLLSETIRVQNEKLLVQSAIQKRFFATMSHEIRTPLHGIHGTLQILSESSLSEETESLVLTALTSTRDLSQIVNDVLDFSKIEAGEMVLEKNAFSLKKELVQVVELMFSVAIEKNITIEVVEPSPRENDWFIGDSSRIRQIIANLVNNAVKFTDEGGVRISTPSLRDGDVRILIEDSGVGMSEQGLQNVFRAYQQDNARSGLGTGLGLSICKSLMDLMSGTIEVESTVAVGSKFLIKLPLACAEPGVVEVPKCEEVADFSNLKFLVVDDNPTNRLIVKEMLFKRGASVMEADSGEQALAILEKSQDFRTIFMDISMPGIDGLETAQLIRERNLVPASTRIIAMSAHVQPSERERFLDSGMDGFLGKPFQVRELVDTILFGAVSEKEVATIPGHSVQTKEETTRKEAIDAEVLHQLFKEVDANTVPVLITSFVDDSLSRRTLILDAISREDLTEIIKQAHALGSSAGMFGATLLFAACRQLESTGMLISGAGDQNDQKALLSLASLLVAEITPAIEAVKTYL
jgi:signal transduction histidine kinase/HPt (histidine-containing phosphotransfer) domain-containing protein